MRSVYTQKNNVSYIFSCCTRSFAARIFGQCFRKQRQFSEYIDVIISDFKIQFKKWEVANWQKWKNELEVGYVDFKYRPHYKCHCWTLLVIEISFLEVSRASHRDPGKYDARPDGSCHGDVSFPHINGQGWGAEPELCSGWWANERHHRRPPGLDYVSV